MIAPLGKPGQRGTQVTQASASASTCPICNQSHDEIVEHLVQGEIRRISDGDLAAEVAYTQREIADDPGEREPGLRHRLAVLDDEARRRRRIAAKGGPLYRGRGNISSERIRAAKTKHVLAELIGLDLSIAWTRGGRTYFHCDIHGDGRDLNPSLVAYEAEGRWWCYGCASGGDAIDWMIARHNMNFRQAVEALT
ncbi:MAG: hypothetical protein IIA90_09020 [Chloroflexi bacterium]|nr:hypothetical protein [Chloroflexota bacterium]